MNAEATYARGAGVLIGTDAHWVLVSDPGDEAVVRDLWHLLTRAPSDHHEVVRQVQRLLEPAFGAEPPGLAIVTLTAHGPASTIVGAGHVSSEGTVCHLWLDGASTVGASRPLKAGVVAADRAELSPVGAAPTDGASSDRAGLIDGIPAAILAAKGPDGPPPHLRLQQQAAPEPAAPEPEPADTGPVDTGPFDTAPDESGHTRVRSSTHLDQHSVPTVMAVSCPLGHLSSPASPSCRVCHQRIAPQEPQRAPRPVLGGLRLPTGEVVPLDRGVVLGRKPAPLPRSTDWPHLVHLPSDHSFVSRMHLQIQLEGWDVLARDLDSRGGTTITLPGKPAEHMRPGEAYVLAPGTVLDMAAVCAVRFETGVGGPR